MSSVATLTAAHLDRAAYVYIRQSSEFQVQNHVERQRLQYAMADHGESSPTIPTPMMAIRSRSNALAFLVNTGEHRWTTDAQTGALIRDLARMLPDELIAGALNRLGKKTGKGNSWTKTKKSNSANVRLSPSISDSVHFHRPFKRLRHVGISTGHLHRPYPPISVRSE